MTHDAMEQFIRDELVYLWSQLWDAYQHYLDGWWKGRHPVPWNHTHEMLSHMPTWSGRCNGLGERITAATVLVGPVSCHDISMTAMADGWFTWANERLGIENPNLPDEELLTRCRQYVIDQRKGPA